MRRPLLAQFTGSMLYDDLYYYHEVDIFDQLVMHRGNCDFCHPGKLKNWKQCKHFCSMGSAQADGCMIREGVEYCMVNGHGNVILALDRLGKLV